MFRLLRCGNNSVIDERANRPGCFGSTSHVIVSEARDFNADELTVLPQKTELDKLIDMIEASETADETETEEEDGDEWDISCLLGESLLTNYSPDTVDTNRVLHGKTLVLLYFGNGEPKDLEMLKLFDSGYHHSVLSVIYCHDDLSAFVDMPARWFAALNVAELSASLGNIEEKCLMVIDPESGDVLCDNALDAIVTLDTSDAGIYDKQACDLFQSWVEHLPVRQSVIGEMEFVFHEKAEEDAFTQSTAGESSNDESEGESSVVGTCKESRLDYV